MGAWYTIGLFVGLGVACGVFLAGLLAVGRAGTLAAIILGTVAGAALGFAFSDWPQVVGGAVGGLLGAAGAAQIVAGTLRRGGTRAGTAVLLAVGALALAALAFVPVARLSRGGRGPGARPPAPAPCGLDLCRPPHPRAGLTARCPASSS